MLLQMGYEEWIEEIDRLMEKNVRLKEENVRLKENYVRLKKELEQSKEKLKMLLNEKGISYEEFEARYASMDKSES
jgi:predicted nuclease with TOPRIM domain